MWFGTPTELRQGHEYSLNPGSLIFVLAIVIRGRAVRLTPTNPDQGLGRLRTKGTDTEPSRAKVPCKHIRTKI